MKTTQFKRFNFLSLLVIALFLFSAAAALSGCGGGGGSSSSGGSGGGSSTAAPTVTAISPAGGAPDVSISPIITVTFSEAMNTGSFNATDTTVTSSGGTPVNIVNPVWNGTDTEVSVTPASPLTANTTYTITFTSGGIKAQNGTAIASAYTSSFTTASNAGTVVDMTPTSGISATDEFAIVHMDKNGNIRFGDMTSSGALSVIQLNGTANTISATYNIGNNMSPTINNVVIDGSGNTWAPIGTASTPYFYELPYGAANGTPFTQNTIPSGDSYYSSVSQGFTGGFGIDSNGNMWLPVYNSTNKGQLLEITGASGGVATVANNYQLPSTIVSLNDIAIDSSNNIWMTSSPSSCGNSDELLEFPSGGSSVSVAASLPAGVCTQLANSIAIDPSGNIWMPAQTSSEDVLYYYTSSGSLSPVINLASTSAYPDQMSIAADAAGNIWVTVANKTNNDGELIEVNNGSGTFGIAYTGAVLSFAPNYMYIDPNGNIWMTTNNNTTAANKLEEIPAIAAAGYFAVKGQVYPY